MSNVSQRLYHFVKHPLRFGMGFAHPVLHVMGRENIPEGPVVICCNHVGMADALWVIYAGKFPRIPRAMAKRELMDVPVLGALLSRLGVFPVDRGNGDINAVKTAMRVLREGDKLLIFPEGTRIRKGKVSHAHSGAMLFATRAKVPILPVYVSQNRRFLRHMDVVFGEAYMPEIAGAKATPEELEALSADMMQKIYAMGENLQ